MLLPQCPHLRKVDVQGAECCCICSRAAPSDGHSQEPELGMLNVLGLPGASLPSPCSPEQLGTGLARRAVGELGRARCCLSSCSGRAQALGSPCLAFCTSPRSQHQHFYSQGSGGEPQYHPCAGREPGTGQIRVVWGQDPQLPTLVGSVGAISLLQWGAVNWEVPGRSEHRAGM